MSLRTKLIMCAAVLVIFATVGVYPIAAGYFHLPVPSSLKDMQLKLGLDLKGGVHLVLRVETDTALRVETEGESERLRESLRTANINVAKLEAVSPTQFRAEGVPPAQDQQFRQAANDVQTNFDR